MADSSGDIVVILNPAARNGRAGGMAATLRHRLESKGVRWNWVATTRAREATGLARAAARSGARVVVAAGGDGTANEVANGIIGTNTSFGVLPLGTGNDFAAALGFRRDLSVACNALLEGSVRKVDVGNVVASGIPEERIFLCIAGCGFDARTARRVNQGIPMVKGATAYIVGALLTLKNFSPFMLELELDNGKRYTQKAMFVSVVNTPTTGGGMKLTPKADVNDGLLDICLVGELSRPGLLGQMPRVFSGGHVNHPAVTMLRCRTVSIRATPNQPVLIDGEVLGETPAEITIQPNALSVIVPRESMLSSKFSVTEELTA